jgi:ABC-type branched-subunit amino acid transport system permease subunit
MNTGWKDIVVVVLVGTYTWAVYPYVSYGFEHQVTTWQAIMSAGLVTAAFLLLLNFFALRAYGPRSRARLTVTVLNVICIGSLIGMALLNAYSMSAPRLGLG